MSVGAWDNSLEHDKDALLELLLAEQESAAPPSPARIERTGAGRAPLSFGQQRLWLLYELAPESPAYNLTSVLRARGPLHLAALDEALAGIVERHEILRTTFRSGPEGPVQVIHPAMAVPLPLVDLSELPPAERAAETRQRLAEEAERPFDLERGPALRLGVLRLGGDEHILFISAHHIVYDGWSLGIFVKELAELYQARCDGRPTSLPPLDLQYADYALWEGRQDFGPQIAYWTRKLAGVGNLELPTDRSPPAVRSLRGAWQQFVVPEDLAGHIRRISRRENATLFTTLLAAFQTLLYRYTGQDDFLLGVPVANRRQPEIEGLIGFFVNTLALRAELGGDPTFRELLGRTRDAVADAFEHQGAPFNQVVEALHPERTARDMPLVRAMFGLHNTPMGRLELKGLVLEPIKPETRTAKFDLVFLLYETPHGLEGELEYDRDLFDADTIRRMASHFTTLLAAIAADPSRRVSTMSMLTEDERHRLLIEWNRTETAFPGNKCIHDLLEAEAQRRPEAIAVEFLDRPLSYRELNARANRLAHRLQALGVGPERRVALLVERSLEMVIALVAVLKAGGAYVPLSPDDPDERLALLLCDVAPSVVLTQGRFVERLRSGNCPVLRLDEDWPAIAACKTETPSCAATPDNLAYVLYTSGSTGSPKGVSVSHRSVVRLVKETDYAQFDRSQVFLQLAPLAFDASTLEIWGPLLNGGTLAVAPPHRLSLTEIGQCIRQHRVTTLWLTAGLFHVMVDECLEDLKPLRQLLVGGDVLSVPHVLKALRALDGCRLINGYGPTENTTFTCCYPITEPDQIRTSVPIGRPIANSRVYILDRNLQPTPVGVAGELCISGAGLARGYLGRPDLTEERFIGNPFTEDPDPRLYKTGDMCRYLPDGNIEFLGRRDHQVKIRGFRIELGEIEAMLAAHPEVREAIVTARKDAAGKACLTAYVTPSPMGMPRPDRLRSYLEQKLPPYMVPAQIVLMEKLPLNENGKVDRKALPVPAETFERGGYVPPQGPREQCLAAVWREVLGGPEVGLHDNYFERSGDSITAIQVVSRLRRQGWRLRVADVFRHPTIAQLAPCLVEDGQSADEADDADRAADIPLTAIQRWFFEHYRGESHHFNQAVLLKSAEALDEGRLRRVLGELLRRHDALRLRFVAEDDAVRQSRVPAGEPADLAVMDLRASGDAAAELERHADRMQAGLDLERGPLFKAGLFHRTDGDRLLLVIHHLAVDAVSWRILLEELETAYSRDADGVTIEFGPKTCSFRRWAEAMQSFAESPDLGAEEDYWARVENAEATPLPTKGAGGARLHGGAEVVHAALSPEDTARLLGPVRRAFGTEIMDLLLTALGRALKGWSGGEAARITLEGHGREPPDESLDLTRTVGWFTSLYPFLLSVPGNDIAEHIRRVKTALREVPRKGFGYGILRYAAGRKARPGSTPQLSFNYLGQFEDGDQKGTFGFSDEATGRAVSPHLSRAHELDIVGLVAGGRLLLSLEFEPRTLARATAVALLDDLVRQLGEVLRHCRAVAERGGAAASLPEDAPTAAWAHLPVAGDVEDAYPLSPLQEGFLFQSLLDPGAESYFVQVRFHFAGTLDPDAFREAWFALCRRHAVLRSAFVHRDLARPLQVVLRDRTPEMVFHDFRHLGEAERQARLDAFCLNERRRGFALDQEPLLRVAVFREAEGDYHIVWSYHHILIDGWCLSILQRDFVEIYTALLSRRKPRLPVVAPYRHYISWLGRRDAEAARRFWRHYLDGYEHLATLPKFGNADDGQRRSLGEEILVLDADTSARLARLAARTGVTLNAVLQSLWGLLLSRYNDRDEVVFGAIVSGRPAELAGVEEMVGLFIGAVPVRVTAKPNLLFVDLVRAVQDAALASEAHQHLSLADIQNESALGRNLFDHMLIFENYPLRPAGRPAESGVRAEFTLVEAYDPTHYDLDVTIAPGETITVKFTYDAAVYRPDQMRRTAAHMRTTVESILENPARPLREISILPPAERRLVLDEFNATKAEYPRERTFVDLFEEQAAKTPDVPALRCGDLEASYRELNRAANRLAHHLRSLGVGPEVSVGLCVERSPAMIIGPLAIMKAGGVFVPLDPDYPRDRLTFMLADAGIDVLLTEQRLAGRLPGHHAAVVLLDREVVAVEARPDTDPLRPCAAAGDTAYVIFTSGSTGRPKGVAVAHRSIANMVHAWRKAYGLGDFPVRLLQLASMSFDVFIGDLVRALTNGGTLVVCPADVQVDPPSLYRLLASHRISIFESTPGLVLPLMEHVYRNQLPVDALRLLIVGSDLLPARHFRTLVGRFGSRLRVVNSYGVTEVTIDSSFFEAADLEALDLPANTPIGKPLANTRFYVLDRCRQAQPLGVPGELYIGGDGVAKGYLNRPELTAERFVAGSPAGEERLYRTGDLARWLPDGNLEFLGRIDSQVKVRGYRIELGEIEDQLLRAESVEQAVVLAMDIGGSKDLAAYVVADARWDVGRVRKFLRQALPDYMVPAFFVRLERFPLTPNGKIDRWALPDPLAATERTAGSVPERGRGGARGHLGRRLAGRGYRRPR